ncbi:MAG TPA: aminotransferase class V-fold PLP-dependent enzyme [Longimicrobiaceae bacterium]|nr:aminotransferase class V-fold PLP-dependent enzyme [Longimicrobiaceae bacterium]
MPGSQTPLNVRALRERDFPFMDEGVYLNAAAVTPLPERTRRAVAALNERRAHVLRLSDDDLLAVAQAARARAAALIGADADEIALGGNTSYGINLAALSLPIPAGSTVVVSDREFPANVYPWMGRDYRLETVPTDALGRPDEARLLERLERGDVAAFAISSVQFSTGYRADLARFGHHCRERGIFFVVDGIQSLGQIPLDVRAAHIDVLASGGHKWLLSPFGTGFAYVRREILQRVEPAVVGWTGMKSSADVNSLLDYRRDFRDDARRFEVATLPFQDLAGFAASLDLLADVGVDRVHEHLSKLLQPLAEWLVANPDVEVASDLSPERRSAIVCFRPPSAPAVFERLGRAGIVCSLREGAIRVSPHLYNTREEIGRLIRVLDESRADGWR